MEGHIFVQKYNRTGQDRTGQDRTGQDRTGQDRKLLKIMVNHSSN
jgi:hypothetical protein